MSAAVNLPDCLADYEVLEELEHDGPGVVYRARQKSLDRIVSLHMVRLSEFTESTEADRFLRGARAAALLDHPALVRVYDVGDGEGWAYVATGLFEGITLTERVAGGPLDARTAAELVRRVAIAIASAHKKGILHCGLDPNSIRVDASNRPRITGFGTTRLLAPGATLTSTANSVSSFTAPERLEAKATGDPRVDVYGLGGLLYTALTGKPLFAKSSVVELAEAIARDKPVSPAKLARIPRELEQICLRCLSKNPTDRYATASEVADALQAWLKPDHSARSSARFQDTQAIAVDDTRRVIDPTKPSQPPIRRRVVWIGLAATAMVGLVAVVGYPFLFPGTNANHVARTQITTPSTLDPAAKPVSVSDQPINPPKSQLAPINAQPLISSEQLLAELIRIDRELADSLPADSWKLDYATAAEQFETAFRRFGFDLTDSMPLELRARLDALPLDAQSLVKHWLVRWEIAALAAQSEQASILQAVLSVLDDDPQSCCR